MTTYNAISDPEIAPGAPGTSSLFTRLRDNLLAIIQGDPSAPKISNAALATVPGQNLHVWNAAGTYSLLIPAGITSVEFDVDSGNSGSGSERRIGRVSVTPGETLTVIVGGNASNPSHIKRGATALVTSTPTGGLGGDIHPVNIGVAGPSYWRDGLTIIRF